MDGPCDKTESLKQKMTGIVVVIAFATAAALNAKPFEGQVFIATAGGQAIKLPLVQIAIVPRAELETLIAKVRTKIEDDRKKCYPELADVAQKYKRASEEFMRVSDQVPSPGSRGYAAAYQRQVESGEASRRLYAQRNRLLARRAAIDSPLRYFARLPQPVATAKTDALDRQARLTLFSDDPSRFCIYHSIALQQPSRAQWSVLRLATKTRQVFTSRKEI